MHPIARLAIAALAVALAACSGSPSDPGTALDDATDTTDGGATDPRPDTALPPDSTDPPDASPDADDPSDASDVEAIDADVDNEDTDPSDTDPGDVDLGDTDTGDVDPGDTDPGDTDPGDTDPGDTDPGDTDPGDVDPGDVDPGDTDPGDTDPGDVDPGDTDPGDTDPGDTDPGDTDPGDTDPGDTTYTVDWCRLQWPLEVDGDTETSIQVWGRLYIEGLTDRSPGVDEAPEVLARAAWGPVDAPPETWIHTFDAEPMTGWDANAAGEPNNDEYTAELAPPLEAGTWAFAFAFSGDGGETWTWCDRDRGPGADGAEDGFSLADAGVWRVEDAACVPNPCDDPPVACEGALLLRFEPEGICSVESGEAVCDYTALDPEDCAATSRSCDPVARSCRRVQVDAIAPADGTGRVPVLPDLTVRFSEPMDEETLTTLDAPGACAGAVQLSSDGFTTCVALDRLAVDDGDTLLSLRPSEPLSALTAWTLRVTEEATTPGGTPLSEGASSTFVTEGTGCGDRAPITLEQVYATDGTPGAAFARSWVVLHNRTERAIELDALALWVADAEGATASAPLSGAIEGGRSLLVALGPADAEEPLPVGPDRSLDLRLDPRGGAVALVAGAEPLAGACPTDDARSIDVVGWGTGTCFEGGSAAPALTAADALHRDLFGCFDTDTNSADLFVRAPAPRTSADEPAWCACPDDPVANGLGDPVEAQYCAIQFPSGFLVNEGAFTSETYGRIYLDGRTGVGRGPDAQVVAQVGYGRTTPSGTPAVDDWVFWDAEFNLSVGNDDEYLRVLPAPFADGFRTLPYAWRFRIASEGAWTWCDLDGAGANAGLDFAPEQLGDLTVQPLD